MGKLKPNELKAVLSNLSMKQRLFCEEYVKDGNGLQAAIRAGYAEKSAGVAASRLLKNDNVLKFAAHLADNSQTLSKYGAVDFFNDVYEVMVMAKEVALRDQDPTMVNSFRGLAETLGKHVDLQAFKERLEVEHKTDAAETLDEALARAEAASRAARERRNKELH